MLGKQAWFDFASLVQLSGEKREQLRIQLHRWRAAGKLVPLRRGMYAIAETYRKAEVDPAVLAGSLYGPSYLSLHWALQFHGLIPEAVHELTSVTTRQTKRFDNAYGRFSYRNLKQERFWGYRRQETGTGAILLASPEKALIDLWYLEPGAWDVARMEGMRFQNFEAVDTRALRLAAVRFGSAKIDAAVRSWETVREGESNGQVEL